MIYLITGASRGIGKYLSDKIEEFGFKVIRCTRDDFDVTEPGQIDKFMECIVAEQVVLIHCAGVNLNGFAHKVQPGCWKKVIDINLTGSFNVAWGVLPIMREVGWGRIIFLSSIVGQRPQLGTSAYAASKSGLYGFTKALAIENATKGITVNCLNLGYFDIGMIAEIPDQQAIKDKIPMGDFGDPANIYNAIQFLVSSNYTTGSIIDINGGL